MLRGASCHLEVRREHHERETAVERLEQYRPRLAIGESFVTLLTPPFPSVGVSIAMERVV